MTSGLLRGLAARALGVDAPLRSQRASSFDGLSTDPALGDGPAPSAPSLHASTGNPSPVQQSVDRASKDTRANLPDVSVATDAATPSARARLARRAEDLAPPGRTGSPAVGLARDRPPSEAPAAAISTEAAALPQPHLDNSAQRGPARVAQTTVRIIHVQVPAPLLPLSAPPHLSLPMPASGSVPMRRGQAPRAVAPDTPTEVHVSIGRVELTALAPSAAARAPVRREAPAGRSLADYLRGPGTKSPV